MEFGKVKTMSNILVSGRKIKLMVMECTSGPMETDTKANGWLV